MYVTYTVLKVPNSSVIIIIAVIIIYSFDQTLHTAGL